MLLRKLPLIGALMFALAAPDDAAAANPQVKVVTSAGEFVIELYPDKAPATVENFLAYVNDDFYAGTIFHRVIGNFMIQGLAGAERRDTTDTFLGWLYDQDWYRWIGWGFVWAAVALTIIRAIPVIIDTMDYITNDARSSRPT